MSSLKYQFRVCQTVKYPSAEYQCERMPTCPGCGLTVPYQRLGSHEQYCEALTGDSREVPLAEEFDRRLEEMERQLNRRLLKIEARIQAELSEQSQGHSRQQSR
jgi:hypothetical protein